MNGQRTPRWCGSVTPRTEGNPAFIPCGASTRPHFALPASNSGQPWYFRFHDWFCANHPPIKPQPPVAA